MESDNFWKITDTGKFIPTITYNNKGDIIKTNNFGNNIYHITGPYCNILLTASKIYSQTVSQDGLFFCVFGSKAYDIEDGLQDHFDPNNFIIVYPYAVQYSGNISSFKFVHNGIKINSTWSHPLSKTIKYTTLILDIMTGNIRIKGKKYEDIG